MHAVNQIGEAFILGQALVVPLVNLLQHAHGFEKCEHMVEIEFRQIGARLLSIPVCEFFAREHAGKRRAIPLADPAFG